MTFGIYMKNCIIFVILSKIGSSSKIRKAPIN